ncbi:hypothetical protein LSH36_154g02010 [Paralvinella palmiformis]|uniref:Uncharacterized protein n=1 Tax=Paralvinella palmiformis TaxID=53620 RepID=A0AAD9JU53_9ANNE|nr:hypothetical protein LSH36_154g02010 [Paralvinella palmiformis]
MALTCKEQEIQCVIHWFSSWTEYQKRDFMKDLVDKVVPENVCTLFDAMNGLNFNDKPPSIFKCQLKLFHQWFSEWNDKERNGFLTNLEEVDPGFVHRFNEQITQTAGQA